MTTAADGDTSQRPTLGVGDAVSLIIGIVIGSTIYKASPTIYGNVQTPLGGIALWMVGGVLSLLGALVYAELATTYPRCGGEYNYLSRAYGSWLGFWFGWAQLVVIQTASIGAISFVFADYFAAFLQLPRESVPLFALAAVIGLTACNLVGLRLGTRVQNVLTVLKLVGLTALIAAGLFVGEADPWTVTQPVQGPGWSLSLILILYAYGGWNDAGFVVAEVRDVSRNIPRALIAGLGLITLIYVLINLSYLRALGGDGLRASEQPAADTLALWLGPNAGRLMSILVMISALGSVNGLIFSVSRLHATVGEDHRLFAWLRGFSGRESPVASLIVQALITCGMIVTVGTDVGRAQLDRLIHAVGLPTVSWSQFGGGFDTLVSGSAPAFWLFFTLNAIGYFILRLHDAERPRPFRVPGYPVTPLLFLGMCGWMLYSSTIYAWPLLPVMAGPLLLGLPLYWLQGSNRTVPQ